MPWFKTSIGKVWAGNHRVLGPVVFNPSDQLYAPTGRVRLFLAFDQSTTLLDCKIARACITPSYDETELKQAVDAYCLRKTTKCAATNKQKQRKKILRPTRPAQQKKRSFQIKPIVKQTVMEAESCTPGKCVRCQGNIPPERLVVAPNAIRCVRCQTAWEQEGGKNYPSVRDLGEAWFPRHEHWRNRRRQG